jgi:hypothetical protein
LIAGFVAVIVAVFVTVSVDVVVTVADCAHPGLAVTNIAAIR